MEKVKKVFLFLFPSPEKVAGGITDKVVWAMCSAFMFNFYFILVSDGVTIFSKEILFEDFTDFFTFNNHIASIGSISTLLMGILMLHFLIRIQYESPDDLVGKLVFNLFLGGLFFVVIHFKGLEIDPFVAEIIVDKHEAKMKSAFKGKAKKKYLSILKSKLAKRSFLESEYHLEVLCELGNVPSCLYLSNIYGETKGSLHYWSLKKVLNLNPNEAQALNNLSWSLLTDENLKASVDERKEALDYAQRAVSLFPQNHYYNDTLAFAYFKQRDCERAQTYQFLAIKYLGQELERRPSSQIESEYKKRLEIYQECKLEE